MANRERTAEKRKEYVEKNKQRRRELRKQNKCIICGKDCKPKIIYHQYCDHHREKFASEQSNEGNGK